MRTVSNLLKLKSNKIISSIASTASVLEAIHIFAARDIGALIVMHDGLIAGLVSERDYVTKVERVGRMARDTLISEIMTSPVICVGPDHTDKQCLALMKKNNLNYLPVMDNNKLIGLISIGDLISTIFSKQEFMIQQLDHYFSSWKVGR